MRKNFPQHLCLPSIILLTHIISRIPQAHAQCTFQTTGVRYTCAQGIFGLADKTPSA